MLTGKGTKNAALSFWLNSATLLWISRVRYRENNLARSITDEEIGLIKAMLARGERNVDIQFYFNRQDRPANSGRIGQIRNGTYGPEVPQASDEELDAFLKNFEAAQIGVAVGGAAEKPPTIAERAAALFEKREDGRWYLRDGETSQQECKEAFDPKKLNPIIRAIAALANNKGGFIFLGVEDAQSRVVGLQDDVFRDIDIVQISQKVRAFLTPTPDFIKTVVDLDGLQVGVIYVEKYAEPPVVVSRDGDGMDSGAILFRTPGQSAKIGAGDLLILLRERDHASQTKLLKSAQRLSEIGLKNSLIVDTSAGTLEADDVRVTIDRELADQLEFIREGEFEEIEGATSLRLVGDVRAVDTEGAIQERVQGRALTADLVLLAFLNREKVRDPLEYVRESALVQRQWLPLFYFISLSERPLEDVAGILEATDAVFVNSKANALARLKGERSAYVAATGLATPALERIVAGDLDTIEDDFEDRLTARAIAGLPDGFEDFEPLFDLLGRILQRAGGDSTQKGFVFRAAARLDELAFGQVKD